MGLSIENNLMALGASRNLLATYGALAKSIGRLSSGLRISSAADDAAGLAVRELMRSDIAVLNQGIRNANNAISLLQTMDGAASVIDEKLIRMKELAEQAATGTYSSAQRAIMHDEFDEMRNEIERIAVATAFNEVAMLDGSGTTAATFQILGMNEDLNAFDDTKNFTSAFNTYGSGQTVVITGYDHSGTVVNSSMTITDSTSIAAIVTFIDTEIDTGDAVTVAWNAHTGLTITSDISGVSELAINLGGGGSYPFTTSSTYGGVVGADSTAGTVSIHFGTGNDPTMDYYNINKQDLTESGLNVDALSITTQASARAALTTLDAAILLKDEARAHFGAMINRLENTVTNITIQAENIQAAESQISDVDVATEMTLFVNLQIKAQAASAMLAQANMMPQMALTLLGGA